MSQHTCLSFWHTGSSTSEINEELIKENFREIFLVDEFFNISSPMLRAMSNYYLIKDKFRCSVMLAIVLKKMYNLPSKRLDY